MKTENEMNNNGQRLSLIHIYSTHITCRQDKSQGEKREKMAAELVKMYKKFTTLLCTGNIPRDAFRE